MAGKGNSFAIGDVVELSQKTKSCKDKTSQVLGRIKIRFDELEKVVLRVVGVNGDQVKLKAEPFSYEADVHSKFLQLKTSQAA